MPLPPLWQPNDELKNLIRKGMGKLAQGYLAAEDLYRQNVPAPVQRGISELLDYGNQPQGFVPDSAIGQPQVDMLTRLDNIYPALYKAAAKIGPAAAVLAATVGSGGKAARSLDEATQILWTPGKGDKYPYYDAIEEALGFLEKKGNYIEDIRAKSLDEALDILQNTEGELKPSQFKSLLIDRYQNRLTDIKRAQTGSGQTLSMESPISAREGAADLGSTLKDTGLSAEASFIKAQEEAAFQEVMNVAKKTLQVDYPDPMSMIKGRFKAKFEEEGFVPTSYKKYIDEAGNEVTVPVPVSQDQPPIGIKKEFKGKTIGPMLENFNLTSRRPRIATEDIAARAKEHMLNPTPEAYFGNFKTWSRRSRVTHDELVDLLQKEGATPEEAVAIGKWVDGTSKFTYYKDKYNLDPNRVGRLISQVAGPASELNYNKNIAAKASRAELAKARKANEKLLASSVAPATKDVFYGLPKGTPQPESMKDIQKKTIRKQLLKAMERGWF